MIENQGQLDNTRAKFKELEELYATTLDRLASERVRELTLGSLERRINQLKEEIARYEKRAQWPLGRGAGSGSMEND